MSENNIISELFNGNISPYQEIFSDNQLYAKKSKEVQEIINIFEKLLNEEQILQFRDCIEVNAELGDIIAEHQFTNGFKLGAKLMMNVLYNSDKKSEYLEYLEKLKDL